MRLLFKQWYVVLSIALMVCSFNAYAENAKVWVNSKSHVYHCEGAKWYGKTKKGFFIDEVAAIKQGYRAARNNRCSSSGRQAINDLPNMEGADNKVWINLKSKVYHCQGTRYYGTTKRGRYMKQSEALAIGGRPSRGKRCN